MPATAVVGANWGDEGKGKIVDYLSAGADVVVRFQGGRNAGHTVINAYGTFALHLLPSGVFRRDTTNILGPGVAVDIPPLLAELQMLVERNVPAPRLLISDRAEVVMPYHALLDQYEEERLGARGFGSTKVGIAPFYADKYLKLGVQVCDLFHVDRLLERVERALEPKNVLFEHLYGKPRLHAADIAAEAVEWAKHIEPFVADTTAFLHDALRDGRRILLEGQLGALRDPDHGIYPYPTSSSPLAGFATVGAGVPPSAITEVVAVAKAYSTCVGAGPFVTELTGDEAETLRRRGGHAGEYGATTGRPRRVGWFDAVATRHGCRVQGATQLALTLLDVLGYLEEIRVCTEYDIDGARTRDFPCSPLLDRATPVYTTLPGWRCDISGARGLDALPQNARDYVAFVEQAVETPVTLVSVGPHRDATIRR